VCHRPPPPGTDRSVTTTTTTQPECVRAQVDPAACPSVGATGIVRVTLRHGIATVLCGPVCDAVLVFIWPVQAPAVKRALQRPGPARRRAWQSVATGSQRLAERRRHATACRGHEGAGGTPPHSSGRGDKETGWPGGHRDRDFDTQACMASDSDMTHAVCPLSESPLHHITRSDARIMIWHGILVYCHGHGQASSLSLSLAYRSS
jgi:hypothetical protein